MDNLRAKDIAVGAATYRLNVLNATQGSEILSKLLGMIGDPAGKLFGLGMDADMSPDLASNVLGSLCREIAKPGCVKMVKELLGGLTKELPAGSGAFMPVNFDVEFVANYGVLSALIKFGLEINFESFFVGNPVLQSLAALVVREVPST